MIHICPTNPQNSNFKSITDFIKQKLDITNTNLQGVLIGAKKNLRESPDSDTLFEKFVQFFRTNKIPFSQLKGGSLANDVAYFSSKDEWVISNSNITGVSVHEPPLKLFNKVFDKVELSDLDDIIG